MPAPVPVPIIDVSSLMARSDRRRDAARALDAACRDVGFFQIVGHGLPATAVARVAHASRAFFARDVEEKRAIRMSRGGRAWRGWFGVGDELTSGRPDRKEGIYFGEELGPDHPRVRAGVPMHGANLFPKETGELVGFRDGVLDLIARLTVVGHALTRGLSLALGLDEETLSDRYTRAPLTLFRIFHYPPIPPNSTEDEQTWSVGEHTDYGFLTILQQDDVGGLQVRSRDRWVDVAPTPDAFVCNIGDMLERLTGGAYRSTPHRVRNVGDRSRLSTAFFFDPDFDAEVMPIAPPLEGDTTSRPRWDGEDVHAATGTYGEYLVRKVSRVFPGLAGQAGGSVSPGKTRGEPPEGCAS